MTVRHPWLYGDARGESASSGRETRDASFSREPGDASLPAREPWEKMKSRGRSTLAEGLPSGLPSLHRAHRLQERAAGVGFDWPDVNGPADKVREELDEVQELVDKHGADYPTHGVPSADPRHEALEHELGDLLFAVVNLCRKAGIHPSLALDKANAKFQRRFEGIEKLAVERGIDVKTAGLEALDKLWDEVKASER
jgi:uncharacterized protein YabN with tetrapyrrole methylase and pyrophosphatase domain